jgi:DNA-binding GntR family transcriptional regulator
MHKLQHQMRSFSEEIEAQGGVPSSRLLLFARREPSEEEQEFFGLPNGETVWTIQRVRLRDNSPLALETAVLPCYLCPDLDRYSFVTQSLYRVLEEEYGLNLHHSVEEMSAARPDRQQAAGNRARNASRRSRFGNTQESLHKQRHARGDRTYRLPRRHLHRRGAVDSHPDWGEIP